MGTVQAIIIGDSLRARSAAVRLAGRGWSVQLLTGCSPLDAPQVACEFSHPQRRGERPFVLCSGPGAITLPFLFLDLFAAAGEDVRDYLQLARIEPPLRFVFPDQSTLDLADDAVPRGLERFAREAQRLWNNADELRSLDRLAKQQRRRSLSAVITRWHARRRIGCTTPLAKLIDRAVDDHHLRDTVRAFVSPGNARACPAAAAMFLHAMLHFGAFHIVGGMHRLDVAMGAILRKTSVEIRHACARGVRLRASPTPRVLGVDLNDGEFVAADVLLIESQSAADRLLNHSAGCDAPATRVELALLLGIDGVLSQLPHRTVLLQNERPPIHITVASRTDPSLAPEGCQILVASTCLDRRASSDPAVAVVGREFVLNAVSAGCGVPDLHRRIVVERTATRAAPPRYPDLAKLAARHSTVGGLYVMEDAPCPGAELAIEAITGKISADLICDDHPAPAAPVAPFNLSDRSVA